MRVESKLRIERMMAKEWEILMKMGEGSRGGTSQKAQGGAFISSKTTEEGTLHETTKATNSSLLPKSSVKFICLKNEHQKKAVSEIIQSYLKKKTKK